ncbi:Hypothetical predicted protein [Octopus vulgaris]|uniref:Uncharacterized protein n=1 Tax=Octopus vulgaris TaxID=6645 RepID=A0AA36F063_OCTVU|nr:Hypothetical predicted protein [Octopus vulgaris]
MLFKQAGWVLQLLWEKLSGHSICKTDDIHIHFRATSGMVLRNKTEKTSDELAEETPQLRSLANLLQQLKISEKYRHSIENVPLYYCSSPRVINA